MSNDSNLIIYPLGSEGWIPSNGQETICFAFFKGDEIFILDAGTGIARLMGLRETLFKERWPRIKRAHIFLTHYHLDHCIGLFWASAIFRGIPISVYAPGEVSYGRPALQILDELFRKPYSPRPFDELIEGVQVHDVTPHGLIFGAGGVDFTVSVKLNPEHSDPSVSFRFSNWLAFVTDTPPEKETIEFVKGVKVLLHEAYYDSFDAYRDIDDPLDAHRSGPHTGTFGAGLIAKRAGVGRLVLMHHNPEIPMLEMESAAKNVRDRIGIDCRLARDLEEIVIETT